MSNNKTRKTRNPSFTREPLENSVRWILLWAIDFSKKAKKATPGVVPLLKSKKKKKERKFQMESHSRRTRKNPTHAIWLVSQSNNLNYPRADAIFSPKKFSGERTNHYGINELSRRNEETERWNDRRIGNRIHLVSWWRGGTADFRWMEHGIDDDRQSVDALKSNRTSCFTYFQRRRGSRNRMRVWGKGWFASTPVNNSSFQFSALSS